MLSCSYSDSASLELILTLLPKNCYWQCCPKTYSYNATLELIFYSTTLKLILTVLH